MTVSPKWPDERKKPQFQEGNPDLAKPTGPPNALPPTLFQLPNLRAENARSSSNTEISESTSTPPGQNFAHHVAEMPFGSVGREGTQAVRIPTTPQTACSGQPGNESDDEPRFPTPPAVVDGTETPATAPSAGVNREAISRYGEINRSPENKETTPQAPTDRPAGRSWMDSIGSHGIVVALLLVVVAAALYTGRVGRDDSDDDSLADGRDWLEYGTDDEISLPKAAVADGSTVAPMAEPDRVLQDADQPTTQSGFNAGATVASSEIQLENNSSSSSALLSQPVELDEYHNSQSAFAENSQRNASESFQQPHASIVAPVSPAAARTEQSGLRQNQPRQTGQPASYGVSVPASQTPTYQRTATPSGIQDWSKYFPRVPSGNTVSPTYPSPSN